MHRKHGIDGLTFGVCVLTAEDATLAGLEEIDQYVEERHVRKDKEACNDYSEHTGTRSSPCGQQTCLSRHESGMGSHLCVSGQLPKPSTKGSLTIHPDLISQYVLQFGSQVRLLVHVGSRHTVLNERCTASLVRAVPLLPAARRLPQSMQSGFMELDTKLVRIVSHHSEYRGEIAKVHFKSRTPCPSLASSVVMHMSPSLRCAPSARRCEHHLQDHCALP